MPTYHYRSTDNAGAYFGLALLCIWLTLFVAWCTHLVWSIKMLMADAPLMAGKVILAALGGFLPPIGMIHGIILWFS